MPTFEYQATATDGRVNRGRLFASTLDGAAQTLAGQGLQVTKLEVAQDLNDPLSVQPGPPISAPPPATPPRAESSAFVEMPTLAV
ncbi:hypothetical protein EON81_15505, partial [bacterium]